MSAVKSVQQINLPNGTYAGLWTGTEVRVNYGGRKIMFQVNYDVRRADVLCNIHVRDGWAYITPQ
jgi:hypothetical protein